MGEEAALVWVANAIRFIVFLPPSPTSVSASQVWSAIFDGEPDMYTNQPTNPPSSQAVGTAGNFQATLNSQLGRIDLAFGANPAGAATPETAAVPGLTPSMTDVPAAVRAIKESAHRLATYRPYMRMGVAFDLMSETASAEDSKAKFMSHLGYSRTIPLSSSDLSFQINVPKPLASSAGMTMNRVVRWGTGISQTAFFQVVSGGDAIPRLNVVQNHMLTAQIDINTAMQAGLVQIKESVRVADELFAEALSIFVEGPDYVLS